MRDLFIEIIENIRRNKMRTCLTGFAVAWGIFMLIVLLGAGNGVLNAFDFGSSGIAVNSMSVQGGYTSQAYGGTRQWRTVAVDEKDKRTTGSELFSANVDLVSSFVYASATANYGDRYSNVSIRGLYPEYTEIYKTEVRYGRFINKLDVEERRKVAVIPEAVAERLLHPGTPVELMLGTNLKVGGYSFKIVGITKSDESDNSSYVFAPFSTVRTIWWSNNGDDLSQIVFTFHGLTTEEENEAFEQRYRRALNQNHGAAPDDQTAIRVSNRFIQNMQMEKGRGILLNFLWIVGIFTLLSGVVGVSNIMLITVKERTHEFGIRKAIGASPWSITKLIMTESVCITAFFGYVGMVLGMLTCELLDKTLGQATTTIQGHQMSIFRDPTVGLDVALQATLLLIIAGTIAGLFPARRAAKVRPIEALRAE